jgi:sodium transport system permease protein
MSVGFTIVLKELKDALRDKRTLLTALATSLFGVPLMLLIFSVVLSQVEGQEERREVMAVGMEHAPQLENFIQRQGYTILKAPADYEQKSRSKELSLPVLLVPEDAEQRFLHGEKVTLKIAYDTANRSAEFGLRPLRRLLDGFAQETMIADLTMRGISSDLLQRVEVKEVYLRAAEERRATVTEMLPMMVLMAIVVGGMYASIDTTAGERERGSLEPLMMNPVGGVQLALGKWLAVTLVGMAVLALTILSFFPTQALIQNETLKAEFQFGLRDAGYFMLVLTPLVAMVSAIQIALSLSCKSFKEAQIRTQLTTMIIPMVSLAPVMFPGREPAWTAWVPVLTQNQMLGKILKGASLDWTAVGVSWIAAAALTVIFLAYTARKMRQVVML